MEVLIHSQAWEWSGVFVGFGRRTAVKRTYELWVHPGVPPKPRPTNEELPAVPTNSLRYTVLPLNKTLINPLKTEFLHSFIYKSSPYLTGNTSRLHYKAQPVKAVWGNSRSLL
jgi:hypothetical protein